MRQSGKNHSRFNSALPGVASMPRNYELQVRCNDVPLLAGAAHKDGVPSGVVACSSKGNLRRLEDTTP